MSVWMRRCAAVLALLAILAASTVTSAPAVAKTKIVMWSLGESYRRTITSLLPQFEEAFPHVDLEVLFDQGSVDKLLAAFAAGIAPDIATMSTRDAPKFISQGLFRPLDLSVFGVSTHEEYADLWYVGALGSMLLYDDIYFIPTEVTTFGTYWNKDLMHAAGVAEPPPTWEEMAEVAKRLTRITPDGVWERAGMSLVRGHVWNAFHIVAMMRQLGTDWITPDGEPNFLDERAIQAMEIYRSFYQEGAAHPGWNNTQFGQGLVAMYPGASYQFFGFEKIQDARFQIEVSPYPVLKDGEPSSPSYAWGTFVTIQSQHPRLAWEVAKFFSDRPWAEKWFMEVSLMIPWAGPWVADVVEVYPQFITFIEAFRHAKVEPSHPRYAEIFQQLAAAETKIVNGESDVRPALEIANAQIRAIMREYEEQRQQQQ